MSKEKGSKPELPKRKIDKNTLKQVKRLMTYLKPYRTKFIIGMVCLFLSSFVTLVFPALVGAMIDAAQGRQTYPWLAPSLRSIGFISFGFLFIMSILSFFRIR